MSFEIRTVRTEGLGDSTYILGHDGLGVIVDPQRDVDRFIDVIDDLGIEVRWVVETHLHNDYVSGAPGLARLLGAELVIPAGAAPAYRHLPAFHNETVMYNGLALRPLHTPGHTPEHMSYVVTIDDADVAVFTGGSLLVGSAGRSDLLGADRADSLARLQYVSVNRLAELPGETALFPTHGAGSFCTAGGAGKSSSTIADEVASNPVLAHESVDSFVEAHLSGLVPYPDYYRHMGPINLSGMSLPELEPPPVVGESEFAEISSQAYLVDARPTNDFAAGHIPGSIGIELRRDFGVWVGWLLPFDARIVVVVNPGQSVEEVQRQLARIGFDSFIGVIDDVARWTGLESHETVDLSQFLSQMDQSQILDVRAPSEWSAGTVEGSTCVYVPDLADHIPETLDPHEPVLVACETGYRASIAASLLGKQGYNPVVLVGAGIPDVLAAV